MRAILLPNGRDTCPFRLDPIWDPLRGDLAFQKLCEEKAGNNHEWTSLQIITARQALMDTNFRKKRGPRMAQITRLRTRLRRGEHR